MGYDETFQHQNNGDGGGMTKEVYVEPWHAPLKKDFHPSFTMNLHNPLYEILSRHKNSRPGPNTKIFHHGSEFLTISGMVLDFH